MEIERKWMISGWPQKELPLLFTEKMRQGYLHAKSPVVRIREEALQGGDTKYVLCFKSGGRLVRNEIEIEIEKDKFDELEAMIAQPLVDKIRRTYRLADGSKLEVNHVDEGLASEFWYAEIEYGSEAEARAWDAGSVGLADYLCDDVTEEPGQSMAAYWIQTRICDIV